MKKTLISIIGISMVVMLLITGCGQKQDPVHDPQVQDVLEKTYDISREYVALRYRTDELLINAEEYADYESWDSEMTALIEDWQNLEEDASVLEDRAAEMAQEKVSLRLVTPVFAYDRQEISNVFDRAPAGKKITTLAKHLGVDAKRANQILQNDQAQVQADAWNEAGDTFQTLETSATVIKDGCKVAGFVGGVVISGGTSAIAAGSTLTKAAVIVSGADLVLEVTSDGANIALGNNNKVSSIIDTARIGTEPVASLLTMTDLATGMKTGYDKFNSVMIFLEQSRSLKQENKIIGISIPKPTEENKVNSIDMSALDSKEVQQWLHENGKNIDLDTLADIKGILGVDKDGNKHAATHEKPESIATPSGAVKQDLSGGGSGAATGSSGSGGCGN